MKSDRVKCKLGKLTRLAKVRSRRIKARCERFDMILGALKCYCTRTTFHGLRYVVDSDLHVIERLMWLVMFAISTIVASRVIYTLALGFQAAPTSIDIDSMYYTISKLPFPSVTLCPNDRVDWNRVLDYERRIFPNDTDQALLETFRRTMGKLSSMSFGDFDAMSFLKDHNRNIHALSSINVTELLREMLPSCEELLTDCWWRNSYRNCCEIFELQRTEYGFCYSFNSEVAEPSSSASKQGAESRPRSTFGYGEWSGIRVTIHLGNITKPPDSEEINGVIVMINAPYVWPNNGPVISSGTLGSIFLDCISGYATQRVLELDETKMPCKYDKTGRYNQETCLSYCKRSYVMEYCGCNPSFLFPSTSQRDCTIEDFFCLASYNDMFNHYINQYFHHFDETIVNAPTMVCYCPPECDSYDYYLQFSNVPLTDVNNITLDVHFSGQTSFRYKTDIVITQLDLLVSFGGIMSLFLGGSILSAVEFFYYLIITVVYSSSRSRRRTGDSKTRSNAPVVRTTILPILDYSPLKLPSKRIPIFANYGLAKSNFNRY